MHILFVEPSFPRNQREFVRALSQVGARVTGIGETPQDSLSPELKRWLSGYEQVRSVVDEGGLLDCVRRVQARGWVDRLEATIEAHVMAAAHVREATGIPGTSARTAFLCRDKTAMKDVLRQAGVPCAQSTSARSADDVRQFAARVGFPVILKPVDAAGASGAQRADDAASLERAIQQSRVDRGARVAVEEFIEGHEGFYDTLTLNGRVVHDFACHYFPNVLEAMRTRWISPQIVCTNRIEGESYGELRTLGGRVNQVLGIGTSATHMEWFFGSKGLKFSEIGCRPPGVCVWDLYGAANDIDVYAEWAKLIAHGGTDGRLSRSHAAGMIALRPDRDGKITGIDGMEKVQQRYGRWVIDSHVPPPGTPTQPVEAGYMANAWVRMRHPDFDELRRMMNFVGEAVRLRAE
jgi:formate-dependent phosphoribosylglycinamide formyltransferase (GAR transformylase)